MNDDRAIGVSIAVPLRQHSYATGKTLANLGLLLNYTTTVYYKPQSWLYKSLNIILSASNKKRMRARHQEEIDPFVRTTSSVLGLIFLLALRVDKTHLVTSKIRRVLNIRFGKSVAKSHVVAKSDVLIMYDTLAYDCFRVLDRQHAPTIKVLDMASIAAPRIRATLLRELEHESILKDSLRLRLRGYSETLCALYEKEIRLADQFLVASMYARDSLVDLGIAPERIHYLPLAVNAPPEQHAIDAPHGPNGTLKFLFVGRVEAGKGIHHLLEAFSRLEGSNVELTIVGEIQCDPRLLTRYSQNVHFLGVKRHDEMANIYRDSHVYVLPSLWEGFSFSLLEALSYGLPVIASMYSGAPDIITESREGFVVDPTDIGELAQRLDWFVAHSDRIPTMSQHAIELANTYSWDRYARRLEQVMRSIVSSREVPGSTIDASG